MTQLPPATNESYEIKRIQMMATAAISAFMHQLGGRYPPRSPDAWSPAHFSHFLNADEWRKGEQVIYFHHDTHDHRKSEYVRFTNPVYGTESDFKEGTPKILQNVNLNIDGLTKLFDNSKGGDPLHIAYTETATLENAVATGLKHDFTFDTTTTSETTISGEYAGTSLEEKLTEEIHVGLEEEETRDESESKTDETGVAVEFDCPAGAVKQVVITKNHKKELIPVDGIFVVDFEIEIKLRHWWNKLAGGIKYREDGQDVYKASSVQALYQLMRGVDTDYPKLAGFWQDGNANQPEVKNGILHLLDWHNRSYTLDAEKTRVIEDNADYAVSDLESVNHGDGQVIDLSDEQNRDAYGKAA